MATDGTRLVYSGPFVDGLTDAELTGVMAHEVMHCALQHMFRIGSRELPEWNEACDYAINLLLVAEGFTLPNGALLDSAFSDMSAEQVYAARKQAKQNGNGQPNGSPSTPTSGNGPQANVGQGNASTGRFTQPGQTGQAGNGPQASGPQDMTATDWAIAAEQASAIASKAGRMGGATARAVKESHQSDTDWRAILREFIEQTVPVDYAWSQPNRRYISSGLYLPGTVRENFPRLACAIDTSGSIGQRLLDLFASELEAIMREVRPEGLDVIYCDATVQASESFGPDDDLKLGFHGGGGTRFSPVFESLAAREESPVCLIYFTDLESSDVPSEPEYPVLWITPEETSRIAPFGQTVRLAEW
jgi:predicted metal-dependent peptidase